MAIKKATSKSAKKTAPAKTVHIKDKKTGKLKGSVSLGGKKAPTAKKQVAKKVVELTVQDEVSLYDKRGGEYIQKIIMDAASALYQRYLDGLSWYVPLNQTKRQPFRVENESTTKNYLRGSIYNAKGVKIASYRKALGNTDSFFEVSFADKQSKESFEKAVKSSYDLSGYSDPGTFFEPSFKVNNEAISRYATFLYSKKYPKKESDFLEEVRAMKPSEQDSLMAEYRS